MAYLLCSLLSKGEFLLRIFSQPSAAHYLLSIWKRIIIIKKVIAGKIRRAGNEMPHTTSVSWQPSLSRAKSRVWGSGLCPRSGQRPSGRKQHWECSQHGRWFMILATGWSTGLDEEGNAVAHPATNSVRTFFKACWAQEKPLTHPVQSFN